MPKRVEEKEFKFSESIKVKNLLSHLLTPVWLWFAGIWGGISLIYILFSPSPFYYKTGLVIIAGIFVLIFSLGFFRFYPEFLTHKYLLLSSILILSTALISRIVMFLPQIPYIFIPFAFLSIFFALFFNISLSIFTLCLLCILFTVVSGEFEILPVWFCGGIAGAYGAYTIHQRTDITKVGFLVGGVSVVPAIGVGLIKGLPSLELFSWISWALASGIFSSILVNVSLPYLETYFGITTDIRLMELADLNHPLLHRLSIEAPGTYHHTTTVAGLAVAAAKAVEANPLLARIGAYYHDIGKVTRPHFFFENSKARGEKNDYHSRVSPNLSSVIIISHVKDGLELARIFRLPEVVIDIIAQHHGTSLIAYFYRKALSKKSEQGAVDESGFRYPGPKPRTKEAAIVMLADSVEADTRFSSWNSLKGIRARVQKVINNKLKDHQLEEADLSLRDLNLIEQAFTRVLVGLSHNRERYPEEMLEVEKKDIRNQQYVRGRGS